MAKAYDHLSQQIGLVRTLRKAPAITAVLVRHHGSFAIGVAQGVRKHGLTESDPANPLKDDDTFPMSSVSKPISGYMLAALLKVTQYDWETTIGDVFTEFESGWCRKHFNIRDDFLRATIRQMMTHTARFRYTPRHGTYEALNDIINNFSQQQMNEYCSREALMRRRYNYVIASQQDAPVAVGVYSGGPIIPAAMMERVTGKSYEELMKKYVFEPLDMKQAGIGRTATLASTPDGVWLHSFDFKSDKPVPEPNFFARVEDFSSHAPAGSVHLSGGDAAKFIAAQCVNYTGKRPLKDEWLEETLRPFTIHNTVSGWGHSDQMMHSVPPPHYHVWFDGAHGGNYTSLKIWPYRGEGYMVCTSVNGQEQRNGSTYNLGADIVGNVSRVIENMLTNWRTMFPGE